MSSEIVRRRGRSRNTLVSDEAVDVVDQSEISKTKKALTKKRLAKSSKNSTEVQAEDVSSQLSSATSGNEDLSPRSRSGRKLSATKVGAAKKDDIPATLQATTSPILSQAAAFNTVSTGTSKSKPIREEPPSEVNSAVPNETIEKRPQASTHNPVFETPVQTTKPQAVVDEYTITLPIGSLPTEIRPSVLSTGAATLSTGVVQVNDEKRPARAVTSLLLDAHANSSKSPAQAEVVADPSSESLTPGSLLPKMAVKEQKKPAAYMLPSSQASRLAVWPPRPLGSDPFISPQPSVKQLRPTEMPYKDLKKDPKFRALSRKWTSLIVALPIAIVTSIVLFDRIVNKTPQKRPADVPLSERRKGGATPKILFEDRLNPQKEKRLLEE